MTLLFLFFFPHFPMSLFLLTPSSPTEQAWDIVLPETNGQEAFMSAATNFAYRPPTMYQAAPTEDSQTQILTTGMGGARHLERLSRLRALKGSGRKEK